MTTTYAYAGARPKEVTVTAGSTQQTVRNLEYLPFGPRTRAEFPPFDAGTGQNTVVSTRSYNLRYQVTEIDVTAPTGTVLDLSYTYGYVGGAPGPVDPGPNLDQVVDHRDASQSRFYAYDELDRLWKATDPAGAPIYTYLYDANGNRTQQVAPGGTTNYGYQAATDRLTDATGAEAKQYASDAYGNRIWAGATPYAGLPSHVYDESNRLVEVRDPATQAVLGQYTYDAFGRRVRKLAGGVTSISLRDRQGRLVETQTTSTTPATVRTFVYLEDEIAGLVDQAPSAQPAFAWIHGDPLGTPLAVTNAPSGSPAKVVWRATYAPFGLATPNEDPDGDGQTFALDVRFPGQARDGESGLHDNFYRTYDPATGRYLSTDPIGQEGGVNLYPYAENNPLSLIDPMGLFSLEESFVGRAAAAIPIDGKYAKCLADCIDSGGLGLPSLIPPVFSRLPKELLPPFRSIRRARRARAAQRFSARRQVP